MEWPQGIATRNKTTDIKAYISTAFNLVNDVKVTMPMEQPKCIDFLTRHATNTLYFLQSEKNSNRKARIKKIMLLW